MNSYMFRAKIVLIFTVTFLLHPSFASAQKAAASVASLNNVIGPSYSVDVKGNSLIIDGFREGQPVKQYRVNIHDLDIQTLVYSQDENAVIIRCYDELEDCITHVLLRERKKKTFRKRMIIALEEDNSGLKVASKFRQLLLDLNNN